MCLFAARQKRNKNKAESGGKINLIAFEWDSSTACVKPEALAPRKS